MTHGEKLMLITCSGFGVIIVVATALIVAGHWDTAAMVGTLATPVWVLGVFLWVAAFDSRRRWPNDGFIIRVGKMVTFTR
jgi:hypothetical protein